MVLIAIRRWDYVQPVEYKIQADKPKVRTIELKHVVFSRMWYTGIYSFAHDRQKERRVLTRQLVLTIDLFLC